MLGNCDNKINITTTNQWPHPHPHSQNQIIVDDRMPMASSAAAAANKVAVMAEKPNPAADPHPLKCPRCDSSNTKFCYYNNYSLSQPRHFCKACKRYWTRGGTLRNVPVGGGCRKNKRPKRHSQPHTDLPPPPPPPPSTHIQNPLFYGLNSNPLELNFPFSTFRDESAFDLHPQINALGLGFSSELASSSPFSSPANNNSIFFGSSSSASTMASVLASTHKFGAPANYEDPGVKAEGENRMPWNPNPNLYPNPIDQINSSDPSSLVWNTSTIGAWFDSSSMGSSVPSLI